MFTKQGFARNIIGWVGSSIVIEIKRVLEIRIFEIRPEPQGKCFMVSGPVQRIKSHRCIYIYVTLGNS